jgi:hypothetical protein
MDCFEASVPLSSRREESKMRRRWRTEPVPGVEQSFFLLAVGRETIESQYSTQAGEQSLPPEIVATDAEHVQSFSGSKNQHVTELYRSFADGGDDNDGGWLPACFRCSRFGFEQNRR